MLHRILAFAGFVSVFLFSMAPELVAKNQPTYHYELSWSNPVTHQYQVQLRTQKGSGKHTDFRMPAWRPGSYNVKNFAAAISRFEAKDASGKTLGWRKTDKDTWQVDNPATEEIIIRYQSYANITEQASSYLGPDMAYFNPFTLCMYVPGRLEAPCTLQVSSMPADWKVASQLVKTGKHNVFTAPTYHYLIDSPTLLSPTLKSFNFTLNGTTIWAHFQGNYQVPAGEEKDFMAGLEKIAREQTGIFGELPLNELGRNEYHHIYLLLPYNYSSATEHSFSAMYAVRDASTVNARAMGNLYGITSHEFFHLWNVKRLRPAAMWPYQYETEAYTNLLWLSEGVTSYYDDLTLARAGLLTRQQYLDGLGELISRIENGYNQVLQSAAENSYESWLGTSTYRIPQINPGFFYDQGARLGLLIDLKLRYVTGGKADMDAVMRYLYENYYKKGKGVPENGVELAATTLAGQDMHSFFEAYELGRAPYDLKAVLEPMGLELTSSEDVKAEFRRIGIQRLEAIGDDLVIAQLHPEGDAAAAGVPERALITHVDGQKLEEFDKAAYLENLKTGQLIKLGFTFNGQAGERVITFSGKAAPRVYKLQPKAGADVKWMDSWLGSKAK